jgi:RNA polymerase sigma factor (sigma-70 family)
MEPITDETARQLRACWFAYLDTLEPLRPALHAYCLRLTRNTWDAEDLVQDTLLKGFGMTGRGDLHGPASPVRSARAYLFRTASNLWIDQLRRAAFVVPLEHEETAEPAADTARLAAERLAQLRNGQERAAVVLKDLFEFSLEEIADQLRTTPGTVKSWLHRGRARLRDMPEAEPQRDGPSRQLVDRFVDAFNSRDLDGLAALLTEDVAIDVMGVGGGRGRGGEWLVRSLEQISVDARAVWHGGEWVVALVSNGPGPATVRGATRLTEADGLVSRIGSYSYARDTLAVLAAALGLAPGNTPYHQPPDILVRMIGSTTLPWR